MQFFLKKKKRIRKLSHGLIKEGCVLCGEREKNPERERERERERETERYKNEHTCTGNKKRVMNLKKKKDGIQQQ